jgi:hypothetical protein
MGTITTVEGIGDRFRDLISGLEVGDYYRTFHTTPQHDGSPHIEQEGDEFHFVVTERGSEFERRRTKDPEEILYWLLDGVTKVIATNYELRNRDETRDGREIWFPLQEKLLYELKPEWGVRKQEEHMRILHDHPMRHKPIKSAQGAAEQLPAQGELKFE